MQAKLNYPNDGRCNQISFFSVKGSNTNIMAEVYPLVPKEELLQLIFPKNEVLECPKKIKERAEKLSNAVLQGRFFYKKADLIIETEDGLVMVHANIWEATDVNVLLMGGIAIPVCCIHEVSLSSVN
jgi:hypothetical protein